MSRATPSSHISKIAFCALAAWLAWAAPVAAQVVPKPKLERQIAQVGPPPYVAPLAAEAITQKNQALSFIGVTTQSNSPGLANPISFASVGIGTASADRIVIAILLGLFNNFNSDVVTACSIAGQTTTLVAQPASNATTATICTALVTSGTTGTITFTGGTNPVVFAALCVYTLKNAIDQISTGTAGTSTASGTSLTLSAIGIGNPGIGISAAYNSGAGVTAPVISPGTNDNTTTGVAGGTGNSACYHTSTNFGSTVFSSSWTTANRAAQVAAAFR